MTKANRRIAAAVVAIILVFQILDTGSSLRAVENKEDSTRQLPFPSVKQLLEVIKTEAETWQLHLCLDMTELDPQAVQFALFDHDSAREYKSHARQMRKFHLQQLENVESKPWKGQIRFIQVKLDWDSGFAKVTGADLDLLTNSPHQNSSGIVVSSNGSAGKKWIVTKCVDINLRPYCWSNPVELKMGKPVFVTLDKSNTFDLRTPYDAAMKEPNRDGDNSGPKK